MQKKLLFTLSTAFLLSGLTACNTNEDTAGNNNNNSGVSPVGYYSNENMDQQNGNAYLLENDNDGPLTEFMDRTDANAVKQSPTLQNRFSRDDYNYHGQMATNENIKRPNYYNNFDGDLAEQINSKVQKIPQVEEVRTLVAGDQVLIAIDTKDHDGKEVREQIKNQTEQMTNGKKVSIITDPAILARVRNIDNEIQDGGPIDQVNEDVRDMFREIGTEIDNVQFHPVNNNGR